MTSNAAFKKQTRALSAQEGIPYAEARSRLLGTNHPRSGADGTPGPGATASSAVVNEYAQLIGKAVIVRAIELATADSKFDLAERTWVESREREGFRVVEGGQTGPYSSDDKAPWEIKDWRTGKMLATGFSAYEDMTWEPGWVDISVAVSDGALDVNGLDHDTTVLEELPDDEPELVRFVERLIAAMNNEEWPHDFTEWLALKTAPERPTTAQP
jgi:hypothetical protein